MIFKDQTLSSAGYIAVGVLLYAIVASAHLLIESEQSRIDALQAREWFLQERFFPIMLEARSIKQNQMGDAPILTKRVYQAVVWIGGLLVLLKLAAQVKCFLCELCLLSTLVSLGRI